MCRTRFPGDEVYATKAFARRASLTNAKLLQAAGDVAAGRCDADLGGGVFKQRVARDKGGKSGGFRTIILFRMGGHSFFAHGFAKSEKANLSTKELAALKRLAHLLLGFPAERLETARATGELIEVTSDGDDHEES